MELKVDKKENKYFNLFNSRDEKYLVPEVRIDGKYNGKAYFLACQDRVNWEIKPDNKGTLCLIPTQKEGK